MGHREIIGMDGHVAVGMDPEEYYDEVSGMPREIIGARGRGGPNARLAERIRGRRSVIVQDQPQNGSRRQVCPVPSVTVPAGDTAQVQVAPQRLFKTERISLSQTDAAGAAVTGCIVTDVKVGQNSQFAASGNIPVDSFRPDAVSAFVDLDTADIGNLVTVTYSNPTAADIVVAGALFGASIVR